MGDGKLRSLSVLLCGACGECVVSGCVRRLIFV